MLRIFLFILGFIMLTYSISLLIIYLNLITIGYNLSDYVNFIIGGSSCYIGMIGLVIMLIIFIRKKEFK